MYSLCQKRKLAKEGSVANNDNPSIWLTHEAETVLQTVLLLIKVSINLIVVNNIKKKLPNA